MSLRHSGVILGPRGLAGVYAPQSIFRERIEHLEAAENQANAQKLANQLYYNVEAQSGKFHGYEGWAWNGSSAHGCGFNWNAYTTALYLVPVGQPTVKVWLVQEEKAIGEVLAPEEKLRTGEPYEKIQKEWEAVPLPLLSGIPKGQIQANGTDGETVIWQPGADTSWSFHRLGQFKEGPLKGQWKAGMGHQQAELSRWRGVCAPETGQVSASRMDTGSLMLTLGDIVGALRGRKIEHALGLLIPVTANEHIAPATSNDGFGAKENTTKFLPDGKTPNPAIGLIDAVPEGTWAKFPRDSHASDYGMTGPEAVLYEAGREFGFVVRDASGGNPKLYVGDGRTICTNYCDTPVNPYHGAAWASSYVNENAGEALINSRADPTLPALKEEWIGYLKNMPWRTLEQIIARTA